MKTQTYKKRELSRTKVVNNILRIWELTDDVERMDWYLEAHKWAEWVGQVNQVSTAKVCGILASLSPVKTWNQNLKCASDMITRGDCGHMVVFKDKARRILASDGNNQTILDILNGNKIKAFYTNIMYPQLNSEITIDRHALSIALGYWVTDEDYQGMTKKQYQFFVDCYTKASNKAGVSGLVMQSATWVKWRKIKTDYR